MGEVKALLIAVSDYTAVKQKNLPLCVNDLKAMKEAMVSGLNVKPENIYSYGKFRTVNYTDLLEGINRISRSISADDTFVFYFSGHGGHLGGMNYLLLSDIQIPLQELLTALAGVSAKNKVFFIDSCHSGDFSVNRNNTFDITKSLDEFVGNGYAVLASCGANENSGFNEDRQISLFTGFLCDALTCKSLI